MYKTIELKRIDITLLEMVITDHIIKLENQNKRLKTEFNRNLNFKTRERLTNILTIIKA